ncbi:MAG TPA: potassium channel family protein [Chitinophagales bacterium]|nr:potassium channel family protein [Chitinophagales bacterium]
MPTRHTATLHIYRFELLLFALIMLLFNKIFFVSNLIYLTYVWPLNMILLGLVSVGMFKEEKRWVKWVKNLLFAGSVLIPFNFTLIFASPVLTGIGIGIYIAYYSLLFIEVLRQITTPGEVTTGIILGSVSGYLLLAVVATFCFLLLEYYLPASFNGTTANNIPLFYTEISYFSLITLSTIGYGDITPVNNSARLLAAFFGMAGQFYMVTLVGIIIAKFTSKN